MNSSSASSFMEEFKSSLFAAHLLGCLGGSPLVVGVQAGLTWRARPVVILVCARPVTFYNCHIHYKMLSISLSLSLNFSFSLFLLFLFFLFI